MITLQDVNNEIRHKVSKNDKGRNTFIKILKLNVVKVNFKTKQK